MDNLPNISFVGRSISRREDQRLLTGRGQFIADLQLPQMLHAAFVRSPLAHARIKAIDLSRAAASPGIIYALSGPELTQQLPPVPDTQLALPSKWTTLVQHKFVNPQQPLLAYDKVRHVGEAVAVILIHNLVPDASPAPANEAICSRSCRDRSSPADRATAHLNARSKEYGGRPDAARRAACLEASD
jgi:CO/xanthine dehydrogenase Mo-binding subunit